VTESNEEELFDKLSKYQFSLFPISVIRDPKHSILVSKTGHTSPNISDLHDSEFFNDLKDFSKNSERINLFNLGNRLSPYLSSLKEYRFFNYQQGKPEDLKECIEHNKFISDEENDGQVIIHNAGLALTKEPGQTTSNAPDHLMRLFAYNHFMHRLGKDGMDGLDKMDNKELISLASESYIVTPLSSLVVLETQKDYERFGIEDSQNSLKNATLKSKGAVPEPHEWILIVIAACVAIHLWFRIKF
jgi:XrtN system VIT domain protein